MNTGGDEIIELLKRGNLRAAQQLARKLVTQFSSASYPKVLEQYVKFRQNRQKYSYESGLEPLLKATSPPSDARSLSLLHTFLLELGRLDEVLNIYGAAMQKYPNLETGCNWFVKAIEDMNLKQMVQASFQMRRLSSDPRMLQFWNAMSTVALMKLQGESLNEKQKQLNAMLSFKTVASLAPFQSDQETIIFCHVCELFEDKSREIVDQVLPSFLKGGKEFSVDLYLKNFLIKHLDILGDDENMFKCCKQLLKYLDDFEIISKLIKSAQRTGVSKEEVLQLLEFRTSRNHVLARLELDAIYQGAISEEALSFYLDRFHDKPCCFPDLSSYKEMVSLDMILSVMKGYPEDLLSECNRTKLAQVSNVAHFIKLFKKYRATLKEKPKTDYSSCSVFILKIVESLINDNALSLSNVITSVLILENYQNEDPFNFDTRVWLIVLYNYLGCPTIAHSHYTELKIKNLQHDTLDHLLLSRFSSLVPIKDHPLVQQISRDQKVYESASNLPQFIRISFERKSYSKILGMLELYDKLNRSSAKWAKIGERLQHARLFNDKRGDLLANLHSSWTLLRLYNANSQGEGVVPELHLSENRDFSVLGSMRDTCSIVTEYMNPDEAAILAGCLREMMLELFGTGERDATIDSLLTQRDYTKTMTSSESWAFNTIRLLYEQSPVGLDDKRLLQQIDAIPAVHTSGWRQSHDYHCQLATLKTLDSSKRIKSPQCKAALRNQLQKLRASCQDQFSRYMQEIKECKPDTDLLSSLGYSINEHQIHKAILMVLKSSCNL